LALRLTSRARLLEARLANARSQLPELKRRYKALFAELTIAFFEVDPVGINFEENTDEYEAEVGTVLPRLTDAHSVDDVNQILREEFRFWFDRFSYDQRRLAELAERVWAIWDTHRETTRSERPSAHDIDRP
jgi:hypothetical protein